MKYRLTQYIIYICLGIIVSGITLTCDISGLFVTQKDADENRKQESNTSNANTLVQDDKSHTINTSTIFADTTKVLFVEDSTAHRMGAASIYKLKLTDNHISVMLRHEDRAYYEKEDIVFTFKLVSNIEDVTFNNRTVEVLIPATTVLHTSDGNSYPITIEYEDIQDETRIVSISATAHRDYVYHTASIMQYKSNTLDTTIHNGAASRYGSHYAYAIEHTAENPTVRFEKDYTQGEVYTPLYNNDTKMIYGVAETKPAFTITFNYPIIETAFDYDIFSFKHIYDIGISEDKKTLTLIPLYDDNEYMSSTSEVMEIQVRNEGTGQADVYLINIITFDEYYGSKFYPLTTPLVDIAPYVSHYPDIIEVLHGEGYITYNMKYKNISPIDDNLMNNATSKKLDLVRSFLPTVNKGAFFSYSQDYALMDSDKVPVSYAVAVDFVTIEGTEPTTGLDIENGVLDRWCVAHFPCTDVDTTYRNRVVSGVFTIKNFSTLSPSNLVMQREFLNRTFYQLLSYASTQRNDVFTIEEERFDIFANLIYTIPSRFSVETLIHFAEFIPLFDTMTYSFEAKAY